MNSISIVTICFNNLEELIQTCASVDNQTEPPFEHLIIDGSTQPAIKEYLEQHLQPAYRRWLNERDHGIADAFNKGIELSKGDILVMLNSGDTLFDEQVLEKVSEVFRSHPSVSWMHARYELVRNGKTIIIGKPFEAGKLYRGMRSICHQTMYVKKALHDRYGLYNTGLKIAIDYDFLIRIRNEPFYFLNSPLARFAPEGISGVQYLQSLKEGSKVFIRYFGNTLPHRLWQWRLKLLYHLLRTPVGKLLFKIKVWLKLENM